MLETENVWETSHLDKISTGIGRNKIWSTGFGSQASYNDKGKKEVRIWWKKFGKNDDEINTKLKWIDNATVLVLPPHTMKGFMINFLLIKKAQLITKGKILIRLLEMAMKFNSCDY